jgi:ribonuclease D
VTRKAPAHHPLYLDTASAVARFVESISNETILAIDTEGASFHRFVDRIYLLQLSTRTKTAVIDPLPIGAPPGLGAMVESPQVEVVFHDADYDLRLLHQDYGWRITNIFDTRIAAQLVGLRTFGLAALLEKFFGIKLDKKHQRADWSMRPLTQDMLDYAALDTMYLLDLRDALRAELERLGRWSWAAEEFARLEGTQFAADDPEGTFLRVKGARDLTRRELALLRELVPWRDGVARQLDRSTFRVVGNETLLEISRAAPTTKEALGAVKGMPRGILEQRGADILDAVQRGLAVPEAQLPRFPKAPRWDRDPDFDARVSRLRAVRDAAATRLDLDPGVLCSRDRLESIARKRPASVAELEETKELRRWQVEVLGDALVKALKAPGGAAAKKEPAREKEAAREKEESPYKD